MRPQNALAILALITAVALGLLWWDEPEPGRVGDRPIAADLPDAEGVRAGEPTRAPSQRTEAASPDLPKNAASSREDAPESATITGRVVDPQGRPLLGVRAELSAWPRFGEPEVDWTAPPPVTTGGDGRFTLAFAPPPELQFSVELDRQDLVAVRAGWKKLEPGVEIDAGEVTLEPGVLIQGRIVDREDQPVSPWRSSTSVSFDRETPETMFRAEGLWHGEVEADGTFRIDRRMPVGTWKVRLIALQQLSDPDVVVDATTREVVIVAGNPANLPKIRGVVVDATGRPIEMASVDVAGRRGPRTVRLTDSEGRFAIEKRVEGEVEGELVALSVGPAWNTVTTEPIYRWGQHDVRLVVPASPSPATLTVRAVRADDGSPVEPFTVDFTRKMGGRFFGRGPFERSAEQERHEDGIAPIPELRPGEYRITVEPDASTGLLAAERIVEVAGEPIELEVALVAGVDQEVRVRDTAGRPIARSTIELIDPNGHDIDATTPVRATDASMREPGDPVRKASAETDAEGSATVRGAADVDYVLRCKGAHETVVVPVRLGGDPVEVSVPAGATLRATIQPIAVLEAWQSTTADLEGSVQPSLLVRRWTPDGRFESFPTTASVYAPLDENGAAELRRVPAGIWSVALTFPDQGGDQKIVRQHVFADRVVLTEGETTAIEGDISDLVPVVIRGTATVSGEPAVAVNFFTELDRRRPSGEPECLGFGVVCDDAGRFEEPIMAGTWTAIVLLSGDGFSLELPADGSPIRIVPGRPNELEITATPGRREVRLQKSDGTPVGGGIEIDWMLPRYPRRLHATRTDTDGTLRVHGAPGFHSARIRIRSLQAPGGWRDWQREARARVGDDDAAYDAALENAYVALPPIELTADPDAEPIEIRLPPEWDR